MTVRLPDRAAVEELRAIIETAPDEQTRAVLEERLVKLTEAVEHWEARGPLVSDSPDD